MQSETVAKNPVLLPKRTHLKQKTKESIEFYLFVSPWLIIFLLLGLVPLFWGLYLSMTNYTGYNFNNLHFVGLANYKDVFTDSDAMAALWRTFYITIVNVVLGTFAGFMLAVLLNNPIKGLKFYRTVFYLPAILPLVASGLIWRAIYAKQDGLLNNFLEILGIKPLDWLGYNLAQGSLIVLLLWGAGGALMIYLAGLKAVPTSLYEAATIDGAGAYGRFRHITIPMMTPVLFFNVIMGIIGSLQIFAQPMLLTPGQSGLVTQPITPIYVYMVHAWLQIFSFQRYGYGLALLWVLFLTVLILTLIIFFTSKYWVYYESGEE